MEEKLITFYKVFCAQKVKLGFESICGDICDLEPVEGADTRTHRHMHARTHPSAHKLSRAHTHMEEPADIRLIINHILVNRCKAEMSWLGK